jgi:hypothetical protein
MWRFTQRGQVQEGYPVKFRQLFWKLPKYITKIDAAYQRETDGSIIFFTGECICCKTLTNDVSHSVFNHHDTKPFYMLKFNMYV